MTCSTYYYGGKFRPFTKGHLRCLQDLAQRIDENRLKGSTLLDTVVVGVKKLNDAVSSMFAMEMVNMAVDKLGKQYPFIKFKVVEQTIDRTWAYFQSKPDWFPDDGRVTIAMGEDEFRLLIDSAQKERDGADKESGAWHHAVDITERYPTLGFDRDTVVSSTRVRKIIEADPYVTYTTISDYVTRDVYDFIVKNRLYGHGGNYEHARSEENKFLSKYDITKFPRPSCTATIAVFCCRKVLLVRRKDHPFKNLWALPGGFFDIDKDDSLEDTASRELEEETGIERWFGAGSEFRTYSRVGMDPRGRIVDHVFVYDMGDSFQETKAGDDASEVKWWPVDALPRMAFHHREVVESIVDAQDRPWYCASIGGLK